MVKSKTLREILTPREMEYARAVADCLSNAEIAIELAVTARFVQYKLHLIYEKIGFSSEGFLKSRMMLAIKYDREYQQEFALIAQKQVEQVSL